LNGFNRNKPKTQVNFFACILGCPMFFPKDSIKGSSEH